MSKQVAFLHRFAAPFLAGVSMAGATVVPEVGLAALLAMAGAGFAYASLPAGGRMMERMAGAPD